jgi:hypothetical protein
MQHSDRLTISSITTLSVVSTEYTFNPTQEDKRPWPGHTPTASGLKYHCSQNIKTGSHCCMSFWHVTLFHITLFTDSERSLPTMAWWGKNSLYPNAGKEQQFPEPWTFSTISSYFLWIKFLVFSVMVYFLIVATTNKADGDHIFVATSFPGYLVNLEKRLSHTK